MAWDGWFPAGVGVFLPSFFFPPCTSDSLFFFQTREEGQLMYIFIILDYLLRLLLLEVKKVIRAAGLFCIDPGVCVLLHHL